MCRDEFWIDFNSLLQAPNRVVNSSHFQQCGGISQFSNGFFRSRNIEGRDRARCEMFLIDAQVFLRRVKTLLLAKDHVDIQLRQRGIPLHPDTATGAVRPQRCRGTRRPGSGGELVELGGEGRSAGSVWKATFRPLSIAEIAAGWAAREKCFSSELGASQKEELALAEAMVG